MSDETKNDLPVETEDETNTDLDVVTEDTAGNVLEVVTNFISGLDPSTWLGRNASKAFGKLCSAPSKWYNAYFEGKAAEAHAASESRIKITEKITDQIVQNIEVDPEYARKAGHKFAGKIIGEQINLDKISAITADELKNEQFDNSTNQGTISEPNENRSANSSNQEAKSGEEKIIDDDWLNSFETEARQKSSEDMQRRFAKVLAGEIKKPGSHSIKAVKALGDMDQTIADLFQKLCSMSIVIEHPIGEKNIEVRVVAIDGKAAQNSLQKYGLSFYELNLLNEYGLIFPNFDTLSDYHVSILPIHRHQVSTPLQHQVFIPFRYQEQYWDLRPSAEKEQRTNSKLSGVVMSNVGQELFHIVEQMPMPRYTQDLKKFFEKQNLQMVEVSIESGTGLRYRIIQ